MQTERCETISSIEKDDQAVREWTSEDSMNEVRRAFDGLRAITIETSHGLDSEMRSRHEEYRWEVRRMLIDKMQTAGEKAARTQIG